MTHANVENLPIHTHQAMALPIYNLTQMLLFGFASYQNLINWKLLDTRMTKHKQKHTVATAPNSKTLCCGTHRFPHW